MRIYSYEAILERGEAEGVIVVSFPDVPEAITEGEGKADALMQAEDALGTALLTYPMRGLPLPASTATGGVHVAVVAEVAAKLAVLEAFAASGLSKSELARRLGKHESEVRRILDPMHSTKLPTLREALAALGRKLVVGVEEIATAA